MDVGRILLDNMMPSNMVEICVGVIRAIERRIAPTPDESRLDLRNLAAGRRPDPDRGLRRDHARDRALLRSAWCRFPRGRRAHALGGGAGHRHGPRGRPGMTGRVFDIVRVPRVVSTQEVARAQSRAGCRTGTVILANEQTEGLGRDGRRWESAAGLGLWMSLIHRTRRPSAEWPAATALAALGVALACDQAGIDAGIKWPNDVWLSGRKVAGILADADSGALVIGMGVNILHGESDFSTALRSTATSIAIERRRRELPPIDRQEVPRHASRRAGDPPGSLRGGRAEATAPRGMGTIPRARPRGDGASSNGGGSSWGSHRSRARPAS